MRLESIIRRPDTNIINAKNPSTFNTSLYPLLYLPAIDSLPQHVKQRHLITQSFEFTKRAPSNLSVDHSLGIHWQ